MSNKLSLFVPGKLDDHLVRFTNSYFDSADLDNCDFILFNEFLIGNKYNYFTQNFQLKRTLKNLSKRFAPTGKKVIVLVVFDYEHRFRRFDNLILLRVSMRASKKQPNEILTPYLFECLEEPYEPLDATEFPRIGFCGCVNRSNGRQKMLDLFARSPEVTTDFIRRSKFWGGDPHNKDLVMTFNQNIQGNHFNLAGRGKGNYSMRFYQVLAAGRIPVLVNTDMELPFSSRIPWRDFIVFENTEQACLDRVVECHRQGKVAEMQRRCAEVFHTELSHLNYFKQLTQQLREQFLSTPQSRAA